MLVNPGKDYSWLPNRIFEGLKFAKLIENRVEKWKFDLSKEDRDANKFLKNGVTSQKHV